jgi:hypothetical protein
MGDGSLSLGDGSLSLGDGSLSLGDGSLSRLHRNFCRIFKWGMPQSDLHFRKIMISKYNHICA